MKKLYQFIKIMIQKNAINFIIELIISNQINYNINFKK